MVEFIFSISETFLSLTHTHTHTHTYTHMSEDKIEQLRRSKNVLNLQILCITKLKALLIKSLRTHPFLREHPPTYNIQLLFDTTALKIFGKFREKHQWRSSYCISSNKHPWRLLNFETERFLLEGGVYFKVREMNNIIIIKTLPFFFFFSK